MASHNKQEIKINNLTKWEIGRPKDGDSESGLILLDGEMNRIVSLVKEKDGQITFREECDGYFNVTMPKADAKQALLEALAWIDTERLHELDKKGYQPLTGAIGNEAADEIERLRAALEWIADNGPDDAWDLREKAREALAPNV